MKNRPSNMIHDFSKVPAPRIERSSFQRDCTYKSTINAGILYPFFWDEVLPGDTFNVKATTFARFATPIFPVMDNLYADIHYFFVPNRLVWTNWEKFCGAQDNPGDSISFTIPRSTSPASGYPVGSLQDYFGLPTVGQIAGANTYGHNTLLIRSYNLIWNSWYRDENLQNSVTVDTGNGPDTTANYVLLSRGKRKDYFTSSLPWPLKGGVNVTLPLGTSAPITGLGTTNQLYTHGPVNVFPVNSAVTTSYPFAKSLNTAGPNEELFALGDAAVLGKLQIYADLTNATSATINSIRLAFQIQRFLERDARGGTRYVELLWSHFKVISPDFRLQRPELLGTQSTRINMSPVPQTGGTGAAGTTSPQGNLAAFGTFSHSNAGFNHSFVEHGHVIGLISVRADLTYQQGLDRLWSRQTRYDFYWPVFAHLGEQAILNREIYCDGSGSDGNVFGYVEPWSEYRFKLSKITGLFRSTSAGTLDSWHLSQKFTSLPALNSTFISENPPISRVIAVPSQPAFILDVYIKFRAARPMPIYGTPGMIDQF